MHVAFYPDPYIVDTSRQLKIRKERRESLAERLGNLAKVAANVRETGTTKVKTNDSITM